MDSTRPLLMQKRVFFGSLESLRGVAALLVVFTHLPPWYPPIYFLEFIRNSYLMVEFFFVLSGFVLFHGYGTKILSKMDMLKFMGLRFGRLYPVHVTFLLVILGIETTKYIAATKYGLSGGNTTPFAENNLAAFVEHLFLVQGLGFSDHAFTFNIPGWSISTEFYTYVLFGMSILFLTRKNFLLFSLAVIAVSLMLLLFWHAEIGYFDLILKCLAGFFSGCLVCAVFQFAGQRKLSAWWSWLSLGSVVVLLCLKPVGDGWDALMYPLSALLILSLLLAPGCFLNAFFSKSPLRWLGKVSYSLYMSHGAAIWVVTQTFRVVLKVPEATVGGSHMPQFSPQIALFAYPLTLLAVLLVAQTTFKLVEEPCRKWTRKAV